MTEESLTASIQDLERVKNSQKHEVAAKFLCEARSHLRNGKQVLAERKLAAALNVLSERSE